MSFFVKLAEAIALNDSLLIVALDPNLEMMPPARKVWYKSEQVVESVWQWLAEIIALTENLVCAYKPNLGFYQAFGIEGLELLERVLNRIPKNIPVILDAKHGDLNTSTVLAHTFFEQWEVDAVTLTPYSGQDHIAPFLVYPERGVFILCHTSNPGAVNLQEYPTAEHPYYLQVVREAQTWGSLEQLFLEVGTTQDEVIREIRKIAPDRLILLRSIWAKSNSLTELLKAGLTSDGKGLLIPIPQDWLSKNDLVRQIEALREQINNVRDAVRVNAVEKESWSPNVCFLKPNPHQELILQLYDIGCFLFGNYVQASGATFSYYIDLRPIISNPQVFQQVLNAYSVILKTLTFDRIAGIPYGSLPTATGLSLLLNRPMIYPRKEVKAHGTRRTIEGQFIPGEKVVVVDDILITGRSAMEGAEKLKAAGLTVNDIVVFIDHEEDVKTRLNQQGYNPYSVLTVSEITETLYAAGKINQHQYECLSKQH